MLPLVTNMLPLGGVILENLNEKIIPMPDEHECTALLGARGEVTGYINKPRKNRLGVHWVATFQDGLAWMAKQEMTGEQWRVFAYLVSRLDFDNFLKVTQKEIAKELNMHVKAVTRAIKGLRELDIISVGPMAGHSKTYRLNPRIAHRGTKNYKQTIIDYDELKRRHNPEKS